MDSLITWVYSGGDAFMAQCKLIVVLMLLDFGLMLINVLSDGMRSA